MAFVFHHLAGDYYFDNEMLPAKQSPDAKPLPADRIPHALALLKLSHQDLVRKNMELTQQDVDREKPERIALQLHRMVSEGSQAAASMLRIAEQADDATKKAADAASADINAVIQSAQRQRDALLNKCCPNLLSAAGLELTIGLLQRAGSVEALAKMVPPKIQLLGSEKAFFTHMKTGSKIPRFGVIASHPSVMAATEKDKARIARRLASAIAKAARKDAYGQA